MLTAHCSWCQCSHNLYCDCCLTMDDVSVAITWLWLLQVNVHRAVIPQLSTSVHSKGEWVRKGVHHQCTCVNTAIRCTLKPETWRYIDPTARLETEPTAWLETDPTAWLETDHTAWLETDPMHGLKQIPLHGLKQILLHGLKQILLHGLKQFLLHGLKQILLHGLKQILPHGLKQIQLDGLRRWQT